MRISAASLSNEKNQEVLRSTNTGVQERCRASGREAVASRMRRSSGFAISANNRLAGFFRRQTLAAGFRGPLFHRRLQPDTFNRADFRKAGAADDEACLVGFTGRGLLFRHVRSLADFPLFCDVQGLDRRVKPGQPGHDELIC